MILFPVYKKTDLNELLTIKYFEKRMQNEKSHEHFTNINCREACHALIMSADKSLGVYFCKKSDVLRAENIYIVVFWDVIYSDILWWTGTNVSEEPAVSIFYPEDGSNSWFLQYDLEPVQNFRSLRNLDISNLM
jgi:hypothetical protein